MSLTRPTGAKSNAGFWEFAAQVENCDWGDACRRRGGGGRSVLAAGGFGGFAPTAIEPATGGIAQENPRSGTAAQHGQEYRAGEGSDRRGFLRAPWGGGVPIGP